MLAVIKRPGEDPEMIEMENTLSAFQRAVGGYIETVQMSTRVLMMIDGEGRAKSLQPNILGISGPIIFVGLDGNERVSLTEAEAEFLMDVL